MRTIYRERLASTDPRLGRHVHHDSESKRYAYRPRATKLVSVRHQRRIPVLDQGDLGSCTGNAGLGCLGTDPFYATVPSRVQPLLVAQGAYPFTEEGAVQLYSDATKVDDAPGEYPPTDTGSDGLSIAKVLKAHGLISGYEHAFDLDTALHALADRPWIFGTEWTEAMLDPDPDGRVHPTGTVAGGHEICADELDVERSRIWFTNSWGTGWGVNGRFYLTWTDFEALLKRQGDVTIFVPISEAPPTPAPDPDHVFADALKAWSKHPRIFGSARLKAAGAIWLAAKGL